MSLISPYGDPFVALADLIVGWHKASQLQAWLKLIGGCLLSFWLTFNTVCGGALIAHVPVPVAIGYGMTVGSAMAYVAFLRANPKLVAGITVAVPTDTATDRIDPKGNGPIITGASK